MHPLDRPAARKTPRVNPLARRAAAPRGLRCGLLFAMLAACAGTAAAGAMTWRTGTFSYTLSEIARSLHFVDAATGRDHCDAAKALPFATWSDGEARPATAARRAGDLLTIEFDGPDRAVDFRVREHPRWLGFEVAAVRDGHDTLRELRFGVIPLDLSGAPEDAFGVSPLALNLHTNCVEIPGYTATLAGATAHAKLGIVGAAWAVVAAPAPALRDALKEAISASPGIPRSATGGPWAMDAPINRQSYFLDTSGRVNEDTVDAWIAMLNGLGIKQLDLHGGYAFRWGDYAPNPKEYPRGLDSLKAVVDRLHDAGIAAGLHTYAMFIAKDAPWVTPVPDPGLAKSRSFTLAADLSAEAIDLPVTESTAQMSPLTGFHHRNSATLQLGDELLVFAGVSKEPPYGFTQMTRGAYGTRAAAHARGAKVHHLKECFGLFAPDPDSALFDKVIDATAHTYNYCGFDMMYIDALDGSDVIDLEGGGEFAWHYAARFTWDLVRRLDKAPLMEMSTFGHHLWAVRSRMGAWDACQRAPQTFADIHVLSNAEWRRHFLPTNLGWWGIFPWSGVQPKRSLTGDVAYICGKALGTDSSLSLLLGFSPAAYPTSFQQQRLGAIVREYESLRLDGSVSERIRAALATPGQAFDRRDGSFVPVHYARHDAPGAWPVHNSYAAQTPAIRIEHLLSVSGFDSEDAALVDDFASPGAYGPVESKPGVAATFSAVGDPRGGTARCARFAAANADAEPHRAWATVAREFDPPLDLRNRGLGLWVQGDASGALLNLQLRSPKHATFAVTEHYVRIDFAGWKYIELIESEDYAIERYEWPWSTPRTDWEGNASAAMGFAYPMYHAHLDYGQIGSLRIALNDLPRGKEACVHIGPIKSLPHARSTLDHPTLEGPGGKLTFPVALESGHMLEYAAPDWLVVDAAGELISQGRLEAGEWPLPAGASNVALNSTATPQHALHARVTFTFAGAPLTP